MKCTRCRRRPPRSKRKMCQPCADSWELKKYELRWKQKLRIVSWLGGICKHCGLKDDCLAMYTIHHGDPSNKTFELGHRGNDLRDNWSLIELELERGKCVLLCLNCHAKVHAELAAVERENKRKRLAENG
jgi:hypothetical protein